MVCRSALSLGPMNKPSAAMAALEAIKAEISKAESNRFKARKEKKAAPAPPEGEAKKE